MATYLGNAFSLGMLSKLPQAFLVKEASLEELKNTEFISAIGHETTARVLSKLLGREVPYNRISIQLNTGDTLYVFQIMQRLEEGKILTEEEIQFLPYKILKLQTVGVKTIEEVLSYL